jgi:O-antigen/teichoic acid export membrane protein
VNPSIKSRLVSGGAWAFAGKVGVGLTTLAVNAMLVRLLSPEEVGAYYLILSIATVGALLGGLGLNQAVVKIVAESFAVDQPARARAGISAVLKAGMVGGAAVGLILVSGGGKWAAHLIFDSPLIAGAVLLIAVWIVVLVFQTLVSETFRGFHAIGSAVLFGGLLTSLLTLGFFVWLWVRRGNSDLTEILIYAILSAAMNGVFAGFFLFGRVRKLDRGGRIDRAEIGRTAWPVLVTNLTMFVLTQSDIWIVGAFCPSVDVAIYGSAVRLAALIMLLHSVVTSVVTPMIAEMYAQGRRSELQRMLQTTSTLAGLPALAIMVVFLISGKFILGAIFGGFYEAGALILLVLGAGQVVNVLAGSCGMTLIMTGHQTEMMLVTLAMALFSVGGALWLVRDFGALGVAHASAAAFAIQNILMWLLAGMKSGIWTHARLTPQGVGQLISRSRGL